MSRALVVTTIHQADDPRIRERTVPSIGSAMEVRYATKAPAPSRHGDHEWLALRGGRVRRWFGALRQMLRRDVDVVSLHDPELIPAGLIARLIRRVPVVVDVHEDVPAQLRHKHWVPAILRVPLSWVAHRLLRMAERFCVVTLAEPGYRHLFKREHPVFANYPPAGALPPLADDGGAIVYVGDVTVERGAFDMIEAAAGLGRRLIVVGRRPEPLADQMMSTAASKGVDLTLTGPLPHAEAMEVAARASVGLSLLRSYPNEAGSMPTKVIEYLDMGIPVVATDLPGTRAAVEGLEGVRLVPPSDPDSAREAIVVILADDGLRSRLAVQAADLRERLVWPTAEVAALYASLV